MKKMMFIALLIAANLWLIAVGYAQDSVVVTTTGGSINVAGTSVNAGDTETAAPPDRVSWDAGASGFLVFPAAQSILIGGGDANVVNEIEIVEISPSATQETTVRIISGCIVVDVPQPVTNPFVVQSDDQENSVRINAVAMVKICQTSDGTLEVTRLSGDGQISILAGVVTIVSNVQQEASASCTIPVLNASGVGIGFVPCP